MTKQRKALRALTKATDLVLANAGIREIEQAQEEAMRAGATDEEYSETVWNARRLLQNMTP